MSTARERRQVNQYELHKDLFDHFWTVLLELGRAPEPGEFEHLDEVRRVGGGLNRALALVVSHHGESLWQEVRRTRSEDALVYLAMTAFRTHFRRREISPRVKYDIKSFFGDLSTAKKRAANCSLLRAMR